MNHVHNKSERQLYVGNIPHNIKTDDLMEFLNEKLNEIGKKHNMF